MVTLLPFWDASGGMSMFEGLPESYEDWTLGGDIERPRQALLEAVENALQTTIISTRCLTQGVNPTILEATSKDGSVVVVRQLLSSSSDSREETWRVQKFANEVHLLNWLGVKSTIPVPSVLTIVIGETNPGLGVSFFVMNKIPGQMLMNVYGLMSPTDKEHLIRSYAEIALGMFHLDVPQLIGSLSSQGTLDNPVVGPLLAIFPERSANRTFTTITDYLDFLFKLKRRSPTIGTTSEALSNASTVLESLKIYIYKCLQDLALADNPSLVRCVLVHDDLHSANILVDARTATITGIVDWEFHSVQPAVLAARYPAWISYEGSEDPRFVQYPNSWWEESPAESARLYQVYEEFVKEKDEAHYEALIRGRALRCAVSWLMDVREDVGCVRMKGWLDTVHDGRASP